MEHPQQANNADLVNNVDFANEADLYREYAASFYLWLALFQDPDCITSLPKRLAMGQARFAYHQAKFNYLAHQGLQEDQRLQESLKLAAATAGQ